MADVILRPSLHPIGAGIAPGKNGNDSYTKLLLHCEGADASTTFTDSSASAHTVTTNNNTQVDTAQFKFGSASGLSDGTDDSLSLDGSADFAFGTSDFTIDMWVRVNSAAVVPILYDSRPASTQGLYPTIYLGGGANLTPIYFTNSADRITSGTALTTGAWYHLAVARASGTTRMFLNGVQVGSDYTDSNTYLNGASRPALFSSGVSLGGNCLNGWMDEIRVSNGVARWNANFAVPTAAYG